MLQIMLVTNGGASTATANLNQTPAQFMDEHSVNANGSTVSLNGRPLSYTDYDKTFEEMGLRSGERASLSVIVKADSAR